MTQTTTPPGWYADPQNPAQQRYWDGMKWTEHRAPGVVPTVPVSRAAATSKPWYVRWWAITGAAVLVLVVLVSALGGGSTETTNTADQGTNDSAASGSNGGATKAKAADKPVKAHKKAPAKKAGLDPAAGHENQIRPGSGFQLGDFKVLPGWRVKNVGYGLGYEVDGLRVVNTTDDSHSFAVDIKLYKGDHNVAADITCMANEANPKDQVEVDCFPDGSGKPYDRITISNSY